jgi:hypothetical protein
MKPKEMMLGPGGLYNGKTQVDSIIDKSQKLPGEIGEAGKETAQNAIDKIKNLPNRFSKEDFMSSLNHSAAPMGLLAAAGGLAGMLPGNSGLLRGAARGAGTAGGAVLGNQLAKLLSDKYIISLQNQFIEKGYLLFSTECKIETDKSKNIEILK